MVIGKCIDNMNEQYYILRNDFVKRWECLTVKDYNSNIIDARKVMKFTEENEFTNKEEVKEALMKWCYMVKVEFF